MQEQLQLKILKWNAIEFRDVLKTSKLRTLLFYYFMTIELNTHTHSYTYTTKPTQTNRQIGRQWKQVNGKKLLVSKTKKKKQQHSVELQQQQQV